jgi:hypothetical protein
MSNLLEADLPVLQRATIDTIVAAVNHVGEQYGFEVKSIELFDGGKRLEVGAEPTGATTLVKPYFIGVSVEGRSVAEIAKHAAEGFATWASKQVTLQ